MDSSALGNPYKSLKSRDSQFSNTVPGAQNTEDERFTLQLNTANLKPERQLSNPAPNRAVIDDSQQIKTVDFSLNF